VLVSIKFEESEEENESEDVTILLIELSSKFLHELIVSLS